MAKEKSIISDKTAMVIDMGMCCELACRLGQDFKEVLYYTPSECLSPKMNQGELGYGMPNITRATSPFERFDEIDIYIFTGVYFGEMAEHFESLGKRVWGSRTGEDMEIYRDRMKRHMQKLGLPVGKYEMVKWMDLREYLKNNENVFIKLDKYRGHFETFFASTYKDIEPKIDEIEYQLGPLKYIIEVIVEQSLPDKVEIGADIYTVDGKYPQKNILAGIECKDIGYIGEIRDYKDFPKELTGFLDKMSDTFKSYGYRGAFSFESRVGMDKVSYMIDATCRYPIPPNELQQEIYTNMSEIIWYGSEGKVVDPIPAAKWGVQIQLYSDWAMKNYLVVDFPDSIKKYVKLYNPMRIEGRYYIAPQEHPLALFGSVIGMGDTLEAALEMVKKNAEQVKAHDMTINLGSMDKIQGEMDKLTKFGIKLFSK